MFLKSSGNVPWCSRNVLLSFSWAWCRTSLTGHTVNAYVWSLEILQTYHVSIMHAQVFFPREQLRGPPDAYFFIISRTPVNTRDHSLLCRPSFFWTYTVCVRVCVCQKGQSALIFGMKYGAHENISFLMDNKNVKFTDEILNNAISRAKEFGVPSIVMKLLRRKVSLFTSLSCYLNDQKQFQWESWLMEETLLLWSNGNRRK